MTKLVAALVAALFAVGAYAADAKPADAAKPAAEASKTDAKKPMKHATKKKASHKTEKKAA